MNIRELADQRLRRVLMRKHADRRMRERFGQELGPQLRLQIIGLIRSGAVRVWRAGRDRVRARLRVCGLDLVAVYDAHDDEVVTVFPPNESDR